MTGQKGTSHFESHEISLEYIQGLSASETTATRVTAPALLDTNRMPPPPLPEQQQQQEHNIKQQNQNKQNTGFILFVLPTRTYKCDV